MAIISVLPHLCPEWGNTKRSVDALDLIFRRLVLAARAAGALERPITVGEILNTFVPYASARRDGPIASNDDYLQSMMELVAGRRDLLFADDLMQDDLKAELGTPNPDVTVIRTYANAKVRLSTEGVQRVLAGDTTIDLRPPTPLSPRPAVAAASAPAPVVAAVPAVPADASSDEGTAPGRASGLFAAFDPVFDPAVKNVTDDAGCPYCAQPIPTGRTVRFCPACGQNLLVRRCAGCSAEIESGWKFCVTCGRSAR